METQNASAQSAPAFRAGTGGGRPPFQGTPATMTPGPQGGLELRAPVANRLPTGEVVAVAGNVFTAVRNGKGALVLAPGLRVGWGLKRLPVHALVGSDVARARPQGRPRSH